MFCYSDLSRIGKVCIVTPKACHEALIAMSGIPVDTWVLDFCGEVVHQDPVLSEFVDTPSDAVTGMCLSDTLKEKVSSVSRDWETLNLYSYKDFIPKHAFLVERTKSVKTDAVSYLFVADDNLQLLSMAHYLEYRHIDFAKAYVALTDNMTPSALSEAFEAIVPFQEACDAYVEHLAESDWIPSAKVTVDIKQLQEAMRMSNIQFCYYFGIKLRTLENWRKNPASCPDYVYRLILHRALCEAEYIHYRFGGDVESIL